MGIAAVNFSQRLTMQTWGVRARVTIAASSVLAAVLAIGAIALVALVHQSLVSNLDSAASTRARDVSSLVSSGSIPATLPTQADDSSLIQVVDSSNSVLSASANVVGELPILRTHPQVASDTFFSISSLPVGNRSESFRVAVHPVTLASGRGWIYIATSLAQVDAAISSLAWSLAAALPTLIALVAVTVSLAVGRSLRPIERIRRQAVSIGTDLSQRVPVPQSHDEVSRLAVTVNQMLERLQASAQRQKRFIGDASHELRSPLAALRAQVEVALAQGERADAVDTFQRVEAQAVRMTALIEDLLFLARTDEGRQRRSFEPIDLDEVVIGEFHRLEAQVTVAVRLARLDAVRTIGSPRDLARMIRNIGDNAARHARTEISIALKAQGDSAVITISNDGPPVPIEDQQRIFDRFTRLDDARSRRTGDGGSGLGLAIAQEIATAHGGQIAASLLPNPQSGAAFVITLPVIERTVGGLADRRPRRPPGITPTG
jgi:signal transduction histidine kinase